MEVMKPLKSEMVEKFFKFVHERQKIWYKRVILKQSFPWTEDKILQKYKFCNVYRELDRGTLSFINLVNNHNLSREELFLNTVLYRTFNSLLYLEVAFPVKIGFEVDELYHTLIKYKGKGLYNDAYLIRQPVMSEYKKEDKTYQNLLRAKWVEEHLSGLLDEIDKTKTPEESFKVILKIPYIGSFLAYEIWTDLTYFNFFKQGWNDNDFVNIGPGAIWGIALICGIEKPSGKLREGYKGLGVELAKWLRDNQKYWFDKLYEKGEIDIRWEDIAYKESFSNSPYLSLRNIEHSLCEFRKYYRLKQGEGRRRKYTYREGESETYIG